MITFTFTQPVHFAIITLITEFAMHGIVRTEHVHWMLHWAIAAMLRVFADAVIAINPYLRNLICFIILLSLN